MNFNNAIGNDGGGGGGAAANNVPIPIKAQLLLSARKENTTSRFNYNYNNVKTVRLIDQRELFYIFLLVDIFHDYFDNLRTESRGTIIHKLISLKGTLEIILELCDISLLQFYFQRIKEIISYNQPRTRSEKPNFFKKNYYVESKIFNQTGNLTYFKYKDPLGFMVIEDTINHNYNLRSRERGEITKFTLKKEVFDEIFRKISFIDLDDFMFFLKKVNNLRIEQFIQLLKFININNGIEFNDLTDEKIIELYDKLLINMPFSVPEPDSTLYTEQKQRFLIDGSGVEVSQIIDPQVKYPLGDLASLREKKNKLINNFKYNVKDINGLLILSVNAEIDEYDNIQVNYKFYNRNKNFTYENAYLIHKSSSQTASARSISTGYRYQEFFPKFLGDFNQAAESILKKKIYSSADKSSFFTSLLSQGFCGIYQFQDNYIKLHTKRIGYPTARKLFIQRKKKKRSRGGYYNPYSTSIGWHYETQPAIVQGNPSHHLELHQIGSGKLKIIKKYNKKKSVIKKSKCKKKSKSNVMKKEVKRTTKKKVGKPKSKKQVKKMKGGQDIVTPHNVETGWHYASQPAPPVYSLSDAVEQRNFSLPVQQAGSLKVHIKGVGMRKVRYTKTGKKYVIVNGKRKSLK